MSNNNYDFFEMGRKSIRINEDPTPIIKKIALEIEASYGRNAAEEFKLGAYEAQVELMNEYEGYTADLHNMVSYNYLGEPLIKSHVDKRFDLTLTEQIFKLANQLKAKTITEEGALAIAKEIIEKVQSETSKTL